MRSSSLRCRFELSCGAKIFSCHRQLYYLTHFKGVEIQITTPTLGLAYSIYNTITVLGGISRSTVRSDAPELKYPLGNTHKAWSLNHGEKYLVCSEVSTGSLLCFEFLLNSRYRQPNSLIKVVEIVKRCQFLPNLFVYSVLSHDLVRSYGHVWFLHTHAHFEARWRE